MKAPCIAQPVCPHGRPLAAINGKQYSLPCYSPISWRGHFLERSGPAFFRHGLGACWIGIPQRKNSAVWGETPFWDGDTITSEPACEFEVDLDQKAEFILKDDPETFLLVRNLPMTSPSWNALHRDQLFVDEEGHSQNTPSLASDLWWTIAAKASVAAIRYCEGRSWAHRIIGYWAGLEGEGTLPNLFGGWLFDHSPAMRARWPAWLRERYGTEESLRAAHGDPSLTFANAEVPKDRLRGTTGAVAAIRYWERGPSQQPLADYLELLQHLFHKGVSSYFDALRDACGQTRIIGTDAFKQAMAGWTNFGFFDPAHPYPLLWPEPLSGSGSMKVAALLDHPGIDAVITPIDYQLRGVGGITEPEGIVDSVVLRGKLFFAECDIRTYHDDVEKGSYGTARNIEEFEAINWRNIATGLARGFNPYWMDLVGDWFGDPALHNTIARSVEVLRESVRWPHTTVPGIAVILDDRSALETNGSGAFDRQALMGEIKTTLSRCGVPYRVYLLEDLELDQFPEHRVFYFPNLFRSTPEKLDLLKRKVFSKGHLVLWGPGSGISDGSKLGVEAARKLTGFDFAWLNINDPRLIQISNFDHPLTSSLAADTFYGSNLAYGPLMTPSDGLMLAHCWGRSGKARAGLALKDFRPAGKAGEGWISVFSAGTGLPANLWRNLARYAGAHIYSQSNDVLLASGEVVGLHSIQSGPKEIALPQATSVCDLVSGEKMGTLDKISFTLQAPQTRVFLLGDL